ncbi:MAG: flagellar basal body L-ring protein FlgH, partial [Janthinobacterium lividum]|nr:flagellar basal body L-ring protein FlgH [Janthinobacterium lividum]
MKFAMHATAALLLVLMAGCASQPVAPVAPSFFDTPLPVAPRSTVRGGVGGGVFNPDAGMDLISDSRAFRV